MTSERLVALTDGVVAVIITIMVLEMRPPRGADFGDLATLWPVFSSYVLSFVYIAIYWNNHHHFFRLTPAVSALVLWANFHLLFWLALVPFATAWMGAHPFAPLPTALYGLCLLACALAWYAMQGAIIRAQGPHSALKRAIGRDFKGKVSPLLYLAAIGLAFAASVLSDLLYAAVALMWLVPDRRIERAFGEEVLE
jgi:uncharacterized membrane protein